MADTFDTDTSTTPEQYVLRELRARLVDYETTMAQPGRSEWDDGKVWGAGFAVQTLDDLCQSQGVTL